MGYPVHRSDAGEAGVFACVPLYLIKHGGMFDYLLGETFLQRCTSDGRNPIVEESQKLADSPAHPRVESAGHETPHYTAKCSYASHSIPIISSNEWVVRVMMERRAVQTEHEHPSYSKRSAQITLDEQMHP